MYGLFLFSIKKIIDVFRLVEYPNQANYFFSTEERIRKISSKLNNCCHSPEIQGLIIIGQFITRAKEKTYKLKSQKNLRFCKTL